MDMIWYDRLDKSLFPMNSMIWPRYVLCMYVCYAFVVCVCVLASLRFFPFFYFPLLFSFSCHTFGRSVFYFLFSCLSLYWRHLEGMDGYAFDGEYGKDRCLYPLISLAEYN